jgi:uroporphyrin-III C-methyltransferase
MNPGALVLAAHGSRRDAGANALVQRHADEVRARSVFAEVAVAFHQGQPRFETVLDTLRARNVTVVPFMTSAGHYCDTVLPRALRPRAGVRLRITPPLGTHPRLVDIVARRAAALMRQSGLPSEHTTIAVVGHGTPRHAQSRAATQALARGLAARRVARHAVIAFIDDDPPLAALPSLVNSRHLVVIPFLIGGSVHALRDIPAALPGHVVIDQPIGTYHELPDLLIELALRARRRPAGRVELVGAGPGDPGLITVRGLEALRQADVIVHDRLVAPELLNGARADAEIIDAGKAPGCAPHSQADINALIVQRARLGRHVVRLKGGDPFVFGRGAEEVAACEAAGVPVSVVPGISSALAGPAAAGIPVTARGLASSFAVVTAHRAGDAALSPGSLAVLACLDTVVVLMGRASLRTFARGLIAAGRHPATPAACIQDATTPRQRTAVATLGTIADVADREGIESPVVIVVGDVAAFGQRSAGLGSRSSRGGWVTTSPAQDVRLA